MESDLTFPEVAKISLYSSFTRSKSGRFATMSPGTRHGLPCLSKAHVASMDEDPIHRVPSDASFTSGDVQRSLGSVGRIRPNSFAINALRSKSSEIKEAKTNTAEHVMHLLSQPSDEVGSLGKCQSI